MKGQEFDNVYERVRKAVAEAFAIDPATVNLESRFKEDLKADSLDIATLLMLLEDESSVHISEQHAATLHSVNDVVALILNTTKEN